MTEVRHRLPDVGFEDRMETVEFRVAPEPHIVVDGDRLTGHSKAGRLPRSVVTGVRRQGRIA